AAVDVDREAVADPHERLLDRRVRGAGALDHHLVADAELALLDLRDLVATGVLEDERVAEAHRLAVDPEGAVALLVLDPVVVSDRDQLLAHLVADGRGVLVAVSSQGHGVPPWVSRSPGAARAGARSAVIRTMADASGAARTRPIIPNSAPPPIVRISTASGWMPSAAPIASGWINCWSTPFASSATIAIAIAASVPLPPSAIRTANAPAVHAPMYGM